MTLQRTRLSRPEIEREAHTLLEQFCLLEVPVNPAVLAEKLGVSVFAAVFDSPTIRGLAFKKDGKTMIYVNANDPPNRRRFTLAHELGHAVLHFRESPNGKFVDTDAEFLFRASGQFAAGEEDIEANQFAAAVLMDEGLVKERCGQKTAEELAREFSVSAEALRIRLKTLGLSDNCVVD